MRSTKWVACNQQQEASHITMLNTRTAPAVAHQAVSHLSHACLESKAAQSDSATQEASTQRRQTMWRGLACSTMGPPDLSMSHLQCIDTHWRWCVGREVAGEPG